MDSPVDVALADELLRAGRGAEAYPIVAEALRAESENSGLWYRMARIELMRGNHRDAIDAARTAMAIKPDLFGARSILATILVDYGKQEEAIAVADELVELWPDVPYSYYERAEVYLDSYSSLAAALQGFEPRDYLAAGLADIDRAIEFDPTIDYFHLLRGQLLMRWGAPDDARAALEQALRLDPTNASAMAELTRLDG